MTVYIIIGSVVLLLIVGGIARHRRARNKVLSVAEDDCTGCQRCIKRCRRKALSVVDKKVVLNPEKCTTCGDCVSACKFNALKITNRTI